MGVSSDAELSVLTGLYPTGDSTLYWEHDGYDINSLVKYFNQEGYYTEAIHGDKKTFYNRDFAYPELIGFDNFYSIENFVEDGYNIEEGFMYDTANQLTHISPWPSDYLLAETVSNFGNSLAAMNQSFMSEKGRIQ